MAFNFTDSRTPVRSDIQQLFRREWDRLARPGTWWTGAERVAIAAESRFARDQAAASPPVLPSAGSEAARTIAAKPATITRTWVEKVSSDLRYPAYVELVGVASRLVAVDTFHVAIGAPLEALPVPEPGNPTETDEPRARLSAAWVPMVGGASITQALSLVSAASAAQEDMHGPLYLTYEGMAQLDYVGALNRMQMELVAARTSALNECFY